MLDRLTLPVTLHAAEALVLRRAGRDDLGAIMRLLSDDPVSAGRGDVGSADDEPAYAAALDRILTDPGNDLLVAVRASGTAAGTAAGSGTAEVVGTFQLTLIPGMARRGSTRLLVEAVRVSSAERSSGIGSALMRWTTDVAAPALGASLVQLTSDAARVDAHRFYRRLGFVDSHVGFKFAVPSAPSPS